MSWYTQDLWVDPLSDDGEGEAEWTDWMINVAILVEAIWNWYDKLVPELLLYVSFVVAFVCGIYLANWIIHV
jgi:hypothetical protein